MIDNTIKSWTAWTVSAIAMVASIVCIAWTDGRAFRVGRLEASEIVMEGTDGSKITLSVANGQAGIWLENRKSKTTLGIYSLDNQTAIGIWRSPMDGPGYNVALGLDAATGEPVLQMIGIRDSKGSVKFLGPDGIDKVNQFKPTGPPLTDPAGRRQD